jgi:transcriptional regulator with XRE-family HTH domain
MLVCFYAIPAGVARRDMKEAAWEEVWDGQFDDPTLGWTLKMGRYFRKLSARGLAKAAGVSPAQVSRIEAERVGQPAWETVIALARALDFNPVLMLIIAGHIPPADALRELRAFAARQAADEEAEEIQQWLADGLASTDHDEKSVRGLAMGLLASPHPGVDWDEAVLRAIAASAAQSPVEPGLAELKELWAGISPARRERILEYARDQHEFSSRQGMHEAHR